ncbi:hypothetical protein BEL04_03555 [Mucilaginibacter sp. PPCGB 2223]|uniref:hypothetical protein n=1 Tax=Mucilaginibacter sp. PPCGB 2223 TaxID=1886027 RepID=UPI000825ABE4|nr:hypothetical protein [Mucilaginibacter sp. PPCGB 2223]OCX53389.1 hypothetical protein BEL04_03555 [Mucilaginibacter sp. PPCGB 2223]
MKNLFIGICCAFSIGANAQTTINKSYPVQPGQPINLNFDYPVIKISTWEKNEVSVIASVKINNGTNDNAFVLDEQTINGAITINAHIKNIEQLPHRYVIVRDGKKTFFQSKTEFLEAQKSGGVEQAFADMDIDIVAEVKVPAQAATTIKSLYGMVELTNFAAPVTIDATYGGIDATIVPNRTGKLQAITNYGQILTNLPMKLTDHADRDFFHSITAEIGQGPAYTFKSAYGKIYIRK